MAVNGDGLLRPTTGIDLDSKRRRIFDDVCPGRSVVSDISATHSSVLWGPYETVRTAHATDSQLRHAGASGGALSALLVHLLESGAVDGVIHVAASDAPAYANHTVVSTSASDVLASAGSRYAPSSPLAGITERLDGETTFAFVGKPCDVSALRALARADSRIDRQIPYMLSFFCAGVPSLVGAEAILAELDVGASELDTFRYRGNGWPGRATARRVDGSEASMTYADSWGGILSKHVQSRCKICPDGTGFTADLVSADAWETDDDGYPLFDERDGVSLLIARTAAGKSLVESAIHDGRLAAAPLAVDEITPMQPGQASKAAYGPIRMLALLVTGRRVPRFRGFHLARRATGASLQRIPHEFGGTLRRRLSGRLDA